MMSDLFDDEQSIQERLELFYTNKGVYGKSILDLEIEELIRYDEAIDAYMVRETNPEVFKDLYFMSIATVYSIYDKMDHQYREFYDLIHDTRLAAEMNYLKEEHQKVVTFLTRELMRRKRAYFRYRERYHRNRVAMLNFGTFMDFLYP